MTLPFRACWAARSSCRPNACAPRPGRRVEPVGVGEPGTAGPGRRRRRREDGPALAAQFADHGWHVTAVDVQQAVVDAINEGRSHVDEEPGLAELVRSAQAADASRATDLDAAAAAREADVVVLIVPVMLDDEQQPDYRYMDAAVGRSRPGSTRARWSIFETTLPVGDTRSGSTPRLDGCLRPRAEPRLLRCVFAGTAVQRSGVPEPHAYPKLVGGIRGPRPRRSPRRSTRRSWMLRSSRCGAPRRPSSASSPTPPTAWPAPSM